MNWRQCTLGELIRIKHGWAFKGQFFSDSGKCIVLTPGNFHEKGGFRTRPGKDRAYSSDFPEAYLLKEGDVIIAMTEQAPGLLGSSALIPESDKYLHNQRLGLVQPIDESKVDVKFIYHLFNTANVRGQISGSASGTKVRHTAPERVGRVTVRIPDISSQRKIAETISAYDDLIENNRRRIDLLEQSARMLYKEWFVSLRFPGHEHIKVKDGVPQGWDDGKVADFYSTTSGGTPSRKNPAFYEGEINWVKTQELLDGFIFSTDEKITEDAIEQSSAKVFPVETVLVAMYGATIGQLGILATPAASNQACCALIPSDSRANYVFAFLFFRENKEILKGLSQGAAQNNINQQTIREFRMVMPSETIMEAFLDYAKPIMEQIKVLQLQVSQLTKARDLLLPRLMNGEIPV